MPPPSIKDIARVAGVSHSTVSRALRGSVLVKEATVERILKIAADIGYRPNASARSLVTRRTDSIGVVATSVADPFVAELVTEIEERLSATGYSLLLATSKADPDRELEAVHFLHERRVDGVLVLASRVGALYNEPLRQLAVPVVLVDNQRPGGPFHSVSIDDRAGARAATRHLLELGHRRVGFIGDRRGFQSNEDRFKGYLTALKRAGIEANDRWIAAGDGSVEGGLRAAEGLLSLASRPTALVCYNDRTALGAMHAADRLGLGLPRDLSVVGFDDIAMACYVRPPLTTIRQPKTKMAELAVATLLALLAGASPRPPRRQTVAGKLIHRDSTARWGRKQ